MGYGQPAPTVRAPALDPTDKGGVETGHGAAIEAPADERAGNRHRLYLNDRAIPRLHHPVYSCW